MCRFFTAVAIYQLQEKGLLNVTDPVGSLFPISLGAPKQRHIIRPPLQ